MNTRTLLFSGAILVSAVTTIGWPDLRLGPVLAAYVFTPLTTMLIMVLAATGPGPGSVRYRWSIVTGLACSLTGDILLMLPQDHFLTGLLCFLVAHGCYLVAFTSNCRFAAKPLPLVFWSGVEIAVLASLWPNVPQSMRIPVTLYACFLVAMASQAATRTFCVRNLTAVTACLGATLFVVSDMFLAFKRFGFTVPNSRLLVLATYFTAQWLIAPSNQQLDGSRESWNSD